MLGVKEKVDVIVLTKNSERLLRKCLASIYGNVPVNTLIVVDGYSTDATLDIVKETHKKHGNVMLIKTGGSRGYARQRALKEVKTNWFMFVDSDVILCKDWFKKAIQFMQNDVGAIWGMEIWSVLKDKKILNLFARMNMKIFEQRGGTHDLLIRRKAIEGIGIPENLHTYEDAYIKSWILKKGFKVISTYDPYCIHYRPESVWTIKESINLIANDLKQAIRHPKLFLSYAFFALIVLHQILINTIKKR
jgi:glycosyltransferase involved in cell wall biosynthesis